MHAPFHNSRKIFVIKYIIHFPRQSKLCLCQKSEGINHNLSIKVSFCVQYELMRVIQLTLPREIKGYQDCERRHSFYHSLFLRSQPIKEKVRDSSHVILTSIESMMETKSVKNSPISDSVMFTRSSITMIRIIISELGLL